MKLIWLFVHILFTGQDVWNTGLQGLSVLEVLQVRWLVQVLPEPESQQRTNRQRNGKILLPAWEAAVSYTHLISIEELNRIYEQLEELPDYLLDDLDSFISCYGSLEELVEHKDDIILYSGCETMTDLAYYLICLLYTSRCV